MNVQPLPPFQNAKANSMSSSPLGAEISGTSVFRKTQRGYAEIAQETQTLHPRLRRFLVFVDGVRTLDQLVELTQVLGSARDALGELYRDGFISMVGAAEQGAQPQAYMNVAPFPGNIVPPSGQTPMMQQPMQNMQPMQPMQNMQPPMMQPQQALQPQQPAQRQGYYPLDQIKNFMVADLKTRMGKDADLVAPKIFAATSPEDLIVMMMRLRDILTKYSNADVAEQFVKKFKDMLI
jgi:hypothetical protein